MGKEYYIPSTSKFADLDEENTNVQKGNKSAGKQKFNLFQKFKLVLFGRSKGHQDDINHVVEKVTIHSNLICFYTNC